MSNETVVGGVYGGPPGQQGGPTSAPPTAPPVVPQPTGAHQTIQTPGTGVFEREQLVGHRRPDAGDDRYAGLVG